MMTTDTIVRTKSSKPKSAVATKRVQSAPISPQYLELPTSGDPLRVPDQTSNDYRTISQKTVYFPGGRVFNCQPQNELREVTVSGMKLVWDANDALLSLLSGQSDLVHVIIVADSIEINMPVKLPQSRVEIFARELIFGENGSIDITPTGYKKGVKPDLGFVKGSDGRYTGNVGGNGMDAQSLDLNIKALHLPEGVDKSPQKRLFACGSRGQDGGDGGHLDPGGKPLTKDKLKDYYEVNKDSLVPPATIWESVRKTIVNKVLVAFPIPIPTSLGSAKGFRFTDRHSNGFPNTPEEVAGKHVLHYDVDVHLPFLSFYSTKWKFQLPATTKKPVPAHGLDAYASGQPGNGGSGGQVIFIGELAHTSIKTMDALTDASGGKQGNSEPIKGESPALNKAAVYVAMTLGFKKQTYRTAKRPGYATRIVPVRKLKLEPVKPRHGHDATAAAAKDGIPGALKHQEQQPSVWVHEFNAEAALTYAKHACMLHNRALSHQIAQTYFDDLEALQHPSPRVAVLKQEFDTLLRRLETDLDIFGNQLGWVPHLSVLGSFDHFKIMGSQAFKTMYLCHRMKNKWNVKESKLDYLTASREAITLQLENARNTFINTHKELAQVQETLHGSFLQSASLLGEIATLEEEIKTRAEIDEANRAYNIGGAKIGFGALKVITGGLGLLTQVIPVGQPFLGLVGGTGSKALGGIFGVVENMVVSALGGEDSATSETGSKLPEKAAQFLKEHQDTIANYASKPFTKKVNTELQATQKELNSIGAQTKELAKDRESLQQLLALPEDKIPEQLERLFRLRETPVSAKEQKELATWLRQKISERITTLEADTGKSRDIIKDLREKSEQADALTSKVAKLAKNKKETEKKLKTVVQGLTQMTADTQDIFDGVRSLCVSREDLEPNISNQIRKLKENIYADQFTELYAKIIASGNCKEDLLRRMERCQIAIQNSSATIQYTLIQMNTIDRQALELTVALDHSIYSSLLSLEQEARSVLLEQLYYFGKSYQYRFLKKVETVVPDYYKLDIFIDKFRDFLESDRAHFEDDIDNIYNMLFAKLRSLVHFLIKDVQHNRLTRQKTRKIHTRELMDEETLQKLNTPIPGQTGKRIRYQPVVFNFLGSGFAKSTAIKFRIADINLKSVSVDNVEQFSHGLNFDMNFVHSGTSILYDGDSYYLFRAQTPSEKVSWEFTLSIDSEKKLTPERVKDSAVSTKLLKKLCGTDSSEMDSSDLLNAYMPAGSSDITIYRTSAGNIVGGEITDFVIEVVLEELHEAD